MLRVGNLLKAGKWLLGFVSASCTHTKFKRAYSRLGGAAAVAIAALIAGHTGEHNPRLKRSLEKQCARSCV